MKVAYADNDAEMLKKMEVYLRNYCSQRNEEFTIDLFTSPYVLLETLSTTVYDFIMLAVVYHEQAVSGLEISNKSRKFLPYTPVIFVDSKDDGNAEICFVYPRRFELKPFSEPNFNSIMDNLYLQIFDPPLGSINVVALDRHTEQIKVAEIVYAESAKKIISVHLYSGKCIKINGPMKKFIEKLSDFAEFLFPHQSFAVNSMFISQITDDKIYLKNSDVQIPIARGKTQFVQECYRKYFKKIIQEASGADYINTI